MFKYFVSIFQDIFSRADVNSWSENIYPYLTPVLITIFFVSLSSQIIVVILYAFFITFIEFLFKHSSWGWLKTTTYSTKSFSYSAKSKQIGLLKKPRNNNLIHWCTITEWALFKADYSYECFSCSIFLLYKYFWD